MNLTLIAAAVSAALAGSVGFGAAWTYQGRSIDALKMEAKDERIAIYRQSRASLERATGQIAAAQTDAKARADRLAADLAAVGTERDRLRDSSATALRTATDDSNACGSIVRAYDIILQDGSGLLREVAVAADQCISDNQALVQGWPR